MLHTVSLLLKMSGIVRSSSRAYTAGCSMVPETSRMVSGKYYHQIKMLQEKNNHYSNHYITTLGFSSVLGV